MTSASCVDQNERFVNDGYVVLREFYDISLDIQPILEGIRYIVESLCNKYEIDVSIHTPEDAMSIGYLALCEKNRKWGGEVYDAVKQIPALVRLVGAYRNDEIFKELRRASVPGVALGGYGIRIDAPHETKYQAAWHQEFPAQLRSVDGVVFWTPLLNITNEMGPIEICVGSHNDGVLSVYSDDGGVGRTGAYALNLIDEEANVSKYVHVAPCTSPGDLILMDYLTIHRSGRNSSVWPRWSIQFRYFNFHDPFGRRTSWRGPV